jgi:autotransporter-associated beta strand protein
MNPCLMYGSRRLSRHLLALAATTIIIATTGQAAEKWVVTGWNNLGMHCMDADYSVFSILPPYNTLHAQVIHSTGTTSTNMVTTLMTGADGCRVTYEAVADPLGSINKTSSGKTNFWTYAQALHGTALSVDQGLAGASMPGAANTPQAFTWNASNGCFTAEGIPIVPMDDAGKKNFYPMMRLKAYDSTNTLRAQADVVVPVSDEMDCRSCHGSNASRNDARPFGGWVNDPNSERDYRLNILKKHDDVLLGTGLYQQSLAAKSYREDGLFKTVTEGGKPILCAACHSSGALPGYGYAGVSPLTQALHSTHARVIDPDNGLILGSEQNRTSCYQCHPGSNTNCLRGAMGSAVAADGTMKMQCQSCHGTMLQVGAPNRTGWLDEPTCQQCHTGTAISNNGSIRYTSVFEASGQPRVAVNQTFATNPNSPVAGKSLYRTSSGHGGMKCQACHGSTHAEYPAGTNDNVQANALQAHEGVLAECTACHAVSPSRSRWTSGPHSLHPMGSSWTGSHDDSSACHSCHGSDHRGTVLSEMQNTRTLKTKTATESGTFWRGYRSGCYSCHNGAGGSGSPPASPSVTSTSIAQAGAPVVMTLGMSPSTAVMRIVKQPAHGTVALSGNVAVYYPAPGYGGTDTFTFAARDTTNSVDSNLGTVTVSAANYLLWRGDGISNQWNTTTSGNWLLQGITPATYTNGTSVTLGDSGSTSPAVNLAAALTPSALMVNSNQNYMIGGTGSLGGTMSLTKHGGGTLTLGGNHTFTGTTTVQGGTIKAGSLVVTGGSSSLGNATSAVTLGGSLGKGTLVYTGNSATFTRGFTIGTGGGRIDAATSGQTLTVGTGNISAGGPLTLGGSGNIQLNSVTSGSGGLTKTGAGRLINNNNQTFTGGLAIDEGTLQMSGGRLFATNINVSIAANAVWLLDGSSPTVNSLTGLGTVSEESAIAATDILTVGNSGASFTFAGTLAGGNATVAGKRAIALTKTGAGTMTLTGTNTNTGATTISAGILQVGAGGSIGTLGSGPVVNNASLVFNRSDSGYTSYVVPNTISGSGALTKNGAGTVTLTGTNTYAGTTTIATGTLQAGAGGTTGTLGGGAVVNNATLVFNRSDTGYIASNAISGTGSLIKTGAGKITLTGANTYAGTTTISEGILQVGSGTATGTLGGGSVLNNASLVFNRSDSAYSAANVVSGTGDVTKSGAGTVSVSSTTSSYAGVTILADGILNAGSVANHGSNSSLGNRAPSADTSESIGLLFRGGTLQYSGSTPQTTNRQIRLGTAGGKLDASGAVPTATLSFTATSSLSLWENSGPRTLTLTGTNPGENTFLTTLADNGGATSLTKTGTGQWVFGGTHTYTGNTTVSGGTLALTGTINSGSAASVRAANGGTLRLRGGNITAGSLVVDIGGTLAGYGSLQGNLVNNGTVLADNANPIVVNGTVTNSGTIRLTNGSLSSTGMFINNGLLDIINGPQTLPPNFQNNGTVLDSRSVRISGTSIVDSSFVISVSSVAGHNYQMQRADSLSGSWQNVGQPQPGSGAALQFTDPGGAVGAQKRFYRIQITP